MDHIWEHPEHSLERTVDTHIKSLRQSLNKLPLMMIPFGHIEGLGIV